MNFTAIDIGKLATGLSRPLVKLLEVVQNGVGALAQPLLVIINAHAQGRARLIRAGYDHRLKMLRRGHEEEIRAATLTAPLDPSLVAATTTTPENTSKAIEEIFDSSTATDLAAARLFETQQQTKRHANVMTIAAEAADQLGDDVSEDPVDPDWIARFFSYAQDISSEQLQHLWGRILAGEVQRPGQVPLRTLDLLRNMTKSDAELLLKLGGRLSTVGNYLPYGSGQLTARELLLAQDAGFLHDSPWTVRWVEGASSSIQRSNGMLPLPPPGTAILKYPSGHVMRIETESVMYMLETYQARPSVRPLLHLLPVVTDVEYLNSAAQAIPSEEPFKVTLSPPGVG
jgi:hypothetical protein